MVLCTPQVLWLGCSSQTQKSWLLVYSDHIAESLIIADLNLKCVFPALISGLFSIKLNPDRSRNPVGQKGELLVNPEENLDNLKLHDVGRRQLKRRPLSF